MSRTRVTAKHPPENPLAHRLRSWGPELRAEPDHPAKGVGSEDAFSAVQKPDAPGSGGSLQSYRGSAAPLRNHAGQENWTACRITAQSPSRAVLLCPALQVWPCDLL